MMEGSAKVKSLFDSFDADLKKPLEQNVVRNALLELLPKKDAGVWSLDEQANVLAFTLTEKLEDSDLGYGKFFGPAGKMGSYRRQDIC